MSAMAGGVYRYGAAARRILNADIKPEYLKIVLNVSSRRCRKLQHW